MKIRDIKQAATSANNSIHGDDRKLGTDSFKTFRRELSDLSRENHQQYMASLIEEINAQGDKISKKADIAEIQKYRELITKLIKENANNAFAFEKNNKFDARGRNKSFAIIRTIDKKLDDLTSEVLKQESENIKVADLVDDIRGLLVDLFM
jgi:uncharacterized protein YaaR (DUF327 family)